MRSEQLDVKVLLKQVYSAHTMKIKGLEDEIQQLKSKLSEAERKINSEPECKRCAELEKAFKSCQAALHEQSKWFEDLGSKFSVFDHPENKVAGNKIIKETNSISKIPEELSSNTLLSSLLPEKSTATKQNFLKNLMSLTPEKYQDSLDLNTAPFPVRCAQEYSTLNSDSMILAPDTMDVIGDIPPINKVKDSSKDIETNHNNVKQRTNKQMLEIKQNKKVNSPEVIDRQVLNKPGKKRSLTGPTDSGGTTKKLHKSSVNKSDYSKESNELKTNKKGSSESTTVDDNYLKDKKSPIDVKSKEIKITKALSSDASSSKSTHSNISKNIPALDIEICKTRKDVPRKSVESSKDCLASEVANVTKNSMYQVSPSLLPLNDKKDKNVPVKHNLENEDIYDFQTPIANKKSQPEDDSAWVACDKKKLNKTAPSLKLKSSSRFKMSLDALPPDYKKPVYRQTKLSKSIFQPKSSKSCKENLPDSNDNPSLTPKDSNIGNLKGGKNATVDFDATCIPDNYEYQIIPSGSKMKSKIVDNESESNDDIVLLNDQSSDESTNDSSLIIKINNHDKKSPECHINEEDTFEDFLKDGTKKLVCSENMNSFDRLPKKQEPNYKYKEETVRKRVERKQLNGFDCKECEKYYDELGLSDKEKQERLKQCSRHRSKFAAPATPEHFWELEFPDTQECKARGYMNETQKVKLKSLRRKPL